MKLLHIIDYFQPQLGYQEYFVAKEQVKLGHDVYIITSNLYFPFQNYEESFKDILGPRKFNPTNKKIDGINVIHLPIYFEQPGKRILLKGLKKNIREINPDIVVAHGEYTFNALLASIWKKKFKYKLIVDSHAHPHDKDPTNYKKPSFVNRLISFSLFFIFQKILWSRRDIFWVSTSSWNLNFFSERCKIPIENISLIAHGSEINRFYPNYEIKKKQRKNYKIDENDIVIIYTGKISERKNVHKIILSTEHLQNRYKIRYLFVGNMENDFKLKFKDLLKRNDKFLTHVNSVKNSEIAPFYQISDIGCWPSESSMSSIDALASGLPIIVSEKLTDRLKYNNGFGIKDGNLYELKNSLTELIASTKLRLEMGDRGRKLATKELNWRSVSQKFVDIAIK